LDSSDPLAGFMYLPNTASTNFSRLRERKEFMRVQKEFRRCSAPSIVHLSAAREPAYELASQPCQSRKGENLMKRENEAVPAMKLLEVNNRESGPLRTMMPAGF
jgi:hypothetical protein